VSKPKDELIRAVGYLACDLAKDADDAEIRNSWRAVAEAAKLPQTDLSDAELETLREYAA
jgi:hypothetical protein